MSKERKGMFYTLLVCLGIIVLILLMFCQAVFGEPAKQPQKEISVILYSAGNGGWESFEQGYKQAENDFAVNINYVVLRGNADPYEQYSAIEREIENGAEGVIVAVSDSTELYNFWLQKTYDIPIITVENGFDDTTIPLVSADNYELGRMLGETILEDFDKRKDLVIAVDSKSAERKNAKEREQGIRDALNGKAKVIPLRVAANGEKTDAAVALDKESLLELSERSEPALLGVKKYGIGNTPSIVAALDQNKIEKIVFQNEFNMGYLAVKALLDQMNGITSMDEIAIESYCVDSESLYETPYEQLLFPIIE